MAKLSILVPIYNVEKYLEQCLNSIIHQTYQDLEIICVDDGSSDSSGDIVDHFAEQDQRIKVIHKANSGYGASLNLALSMAGGEYIGIVESDDYIASDMYKQLMGRAERQQGIDLVKSAHYTVEKGRADKISLFDSTKCEGVITAKEEKKLFAIPCNIWSAIYRRDFLEENQIHFLETAGASYQDTSFYFKAMMMARKIMLTDDAYYYYRIDNEGSSVHSNSKVFCVCDEMNEIDHYMNEHHITDPYFRGVRNAYLFRAYYWNYNRLHVALKSAFYQEFKRELVNMQKTDEFKPEYWTEYYWNTVTYVLDDMEQFFWKSVREIDKYELDGHTLRSKIYEEYFEAYLARQSGILIYGAGVYGQRVYSYLCKLGLQNQFQGFVVSEAAEGVRSIESVTDDKEQILLIVAVTENKQMPMLKKAEKLGFTKIIRVDGWLRDRMKQMEC